MIGRGNVFHLKGLNFFIISTILLLAGAYLIEDNLAVLITGLLYIAVGTLFIIYLSRKEFRNSVSLFFLFFLFYMLHMSIVHYGLEFLYDRVNIAPDELWFYASSNQIITYLKSGDSLLDVANIFIYHESPAYIYLSGHLAIFANEIGTNSVYIQKLFIVFFASLIPVVLYLILKIYVKEKVAVYGAIIYGIFTFITPVSTMILRDIPVALTYIIFFWIILQKVSIKNTILLLLVSFISYYLRVETGIFLMGMSSIYIIYALERLIKSKIIKRFMVGIVGLLSILIISKIGLIDMFTDIFTEYEKFGAEEAQAGSLGLKLASLPYGLNIVGMALFSQIQPFPIWIVFKDFGVLLIFSMVSGITWFFVWAYALYGIFRFKILKQIDVKLKYLFYFSMIYIVLLSSTGTLTRRMIAVYPIIFVLSLLTFMNISKKKRKVIFSYTLFIYFLLIASYLLLKI